MCCNRCVSFLNALTQQGQQWVLPFRLTMDHVWTYKHVNTCSVSHQLQPPTPLLIAYSTLCICQELKSIWNSNFRSVKTCYGHLPVCTGTYSLFFICASGLSDKLVSNSYLSRNTPQLSIKLNIYCKMHKNDKNRHGNQRVMQMSNSQMHSKPWL